MKTTIFFLWAGIVLGTLNRVHAQPSCVTPPSGLIAWWRAETNGLDSAGTNNATLVGGVGFANGEVGQGFLISGGGNDYVALPNNVFPFPTSGTSTAPFSFEVWFKTTTGGVIVGQQDTAPFTGMSGWVPGLYVGTNGLLYGHMWEGAGMPPFPNSTNKVNDGKFHHAAVTYDGTNEALYLDGVDITNMPFTEAAYSSGTYYYQLGTGYTAGWPGTYGDWDAFDGIIDEASIYNRALSAAEVAAIFNAGSAGKCASATSLVANSWTNATSGYWENPYWSLGVLPGPGQDIYITNAGYKAVAIGSSTVENDPQTLDVDSITLSSPLNSFNVLLLNYAGYGTPLTANAITLNSNTVMTILASVVNVTNTGNSRLEVGGTVNQGEYPAVNTSVLSLGNIGPGVYNLTNGTLTVVTGYVGGTYSAQFAGVFSAQFNQYGGYNSVLSTLSILAGGEYDLEDGTLGGSVALQPDSLLKQNGGAFVGSVWFDGTYELNGGSCTTTNLAIPNTANGFTQGFPSANMLQTGGTNQTGPIYLGGVEGGFDPYQSPVPGSYVLSNGLLEATSAYLDVDGSVRQSGGTFTDSGPLTLAAAVLHSTGGYVFVPSQYDLLGGLLAENSITISGYFTQTGGTNQVAGATQISSIPNIGNQVAQYILSGGLFTTTGLTLSNAVMTQSGGSLVTGNLGLTANIAPTYSTTSFGYFGYDLSSGQLTVSSLQLSGYTVFHHQGGTLVEPGLLTLAGGLWDEQTSGQQFGPLQVSSAYSITNSVISLPTNACILRFADSSSQSWSAGVTLTISNWNGSPIGGGKHQVYFGSGPGALTAQQLGQTWFVNPLGTLGKYPAAILADGEIVPALLLSIQGGSGQVVIQWAGTMVLQSTTNLMHSFTDVPGATSPLTLKTTNPAAFFRLRN